MSMTMPDVPDAIEVSDALFAGPVESDPTPDDAAAVWAKARTEHDDLICDWQHDLKVSSARLRDAEAVLCDACGPAKPYSQVSVGTEYGTVVVGRFDHGPYATLYPYAAARS